jgi:hypothetical protein
VIVGFVDATSSSLVDDVDLDAHLALAGDVDVAPLVGGRSRRVAAARGFG